MELDPVLAEVRAVREAYVERFNGDLWAMHRDLKEKEKKSGRKTVSLPPRRPKAVEQVATS